MAEEIGTYLGQKGYSIYKECLSVEEQQYIRNNLNVKPFIPKSPIQPPSFPIYRESNNKLYVPRYFGIDTYGEPDEIKIKKGTEIDIPFNGSLRDYQENIVNAYMKVAKKNDDLGGGGLLEIPCGRGKCLGINTPVMMFDGKIKKVQDIVVGDLLMGDDSTPRKVLSLARGREMMYKINSHYNEPYIVNESHVLSLKLKTQKKDTHLRGKDIIIDIPVKNYLEVMRWNNYIGPGSPFLGYRVSTTFPEKDLKIDPYLLGYWLGVRGDKDTLSILSISDNNVYDFLKNRLIDKHPQWYLQPTNCVSDYCISSVRIKSRSKKDRFITYIKEYGLDKSIHIPHDFKCNSKKNQLELLAGIIDSCGYNNYHKYDISSTNEVFLNDVLFLVRSLGYNGYKNDTYEKKKLSIMAEDLREIPVKSYHSKKNYRSLLDIDHLKYRIYVEPLAEDNYYGFEIDGNRRFLLGDHTVTHNTVIALNIVSQLKTKTLVVVHKGFLLNQWIERIGQFLPTAKVGKIQGQIIDIENKDIVIGMLQSLSMKEYPQDMFESFGLTIVDECHHISSEVFSRSLQKIITKYALGLSATMQRKDGLTRVFKMFLGEIIYKEEREKTDSVLVKAIEFTTDDEDFNETAYDYRGNPAYSTMITKLCVYSHRSEFILRVLKKELEEKEGQQIMILAHNKNLLVYLFKAIEHRNIATVGYYVGGMKECDLKASETKQVIIATYAMASEALDIKTLTTLILATPKTDITQAVGRILRVKHERPLVIDILDSHEVFQRQWKKRQKYYEKNNYKIMHTDNKKYELDKWEILYEPGQKTSKSNRSSAGKQTSPIKGKCMIKL